MKLIIAGGREYAAIKDEFGVIVRYDFNDVDSDYLIALIENHDVTEIVQGGAEGADSAAKLFASDVGLPCKEFRADWDQHGRAAGPIRNKQMADYADALVAFPGGRGTTSMLGIAKIKELTIFERVADESN